MTIEEFHHLSVEEQVEAIEQQGVLISKREQPNHEILLFQIDVFYAEVALRKKDGTIWKVGGFDHPVLLAPYLDQIDLSDLMK